MAVSVLLAVDAAHAKPGPQERAAAEALFREGKKLMAAGSVAEACRRFEESQRIDPQGGTLLAMALCHEKEGRVATAWVEYREAAETAKTAGRTDRVAIASKGAAALEPRLPRLSVTVPKASLQPGLTILRDGQELGQGAWDTAVPVDPGVHEVEASAPGRVSWKEKVEVAEGEEKKVSIPALQPEPTPASSGSALPPEPPPKRSVPTGTWIAGGIGVAALGVGSLFGLRAISRRGESDEHCRGSLCDPTGVELNDEAKKAAVVSNVAFGVGAVGVGVAAYLFFTRGSGDARREARRPIRVVAVPGAREAAIVVDGTW